MRESKSWPRLRLRKRFSLAMCSMRALMSDAFSFPLFAVISICYKAFYKGTMREYDSLKECPVGSLVCSYTQEFLY